MRMDNLTYIIDPFEHNRFVGYVSYVSPSFTKVHFPSSILLNRFRHAGEELQAGLVGNYVAIEGENFGFLGKIVEVSLPEKERLELTERDFQQSDFHPTGKIEILLSFDYYDRKVKKGLDQFPAVGSKVFICSTELLAEFFRGFGVKNSEDSKVLFNIGHLTQDETTRVSISPQALFGRHCAIVGTTGGGKSYTIARLLEEVIKNNGKAILIDPTGEYENFKKNSSVKSVSFSEDTFFHYSNLLLDDYIILLKPSEQVQLPKLQDAIKSLKIVHVINQKDEKSRTKIENQILSEHISDNDLLIKKERNRNSIISFMKDNPSVEESEGFFDINNLPFQIFHECIWNSSNTDSTKYGGDNERDQGNCQSLITRVFSVIKNKNFIKILGLEKESSDSNDFANIFDEFYSSDKKLLHVSLDKVPFEHNIREIIVNAIGRYLHKRALNKEFIAEGKQPILLFMDEAHQFLNKKITGEYSFNVELNMFDQIAKECRKFGIFLVLSTQMPRDLPHGTLSQVGTFLTHRLINKFDKESIENACPEANRYALSFLPILGEGEALLMGVDFPMPVIMKIDKAVIEPFYPTPIIFPQKS